MVYYKGWNNSFDVINKSSSGGIFYELAIDVLHENGSVFGAVFNRDGTVSLKGIDTVNDLDELLGSKYVQARPNSVYYEVKQKLNSNKRVLFCGTPCQCNALFEFLGRRHPTNLLIVDFVCHGIPSEGVWRKYLSYINADVENCEISFRDKRNGWGNYGISVRLEDGKEYFNHHGRDKYLNLFISDLILRPSCYSCKAKGENRSSDITLGDFWGEDAEGNPNGNSLIVERSQYGRSSLQAISDRVTVVQISPEEALRKNKSYYSSCTLPYRRKWSFEEYKKSSTKYFDNAEAYTSIPLIERVICKVQRKIENKLSKKRKVHKYLELKNPREISEKMLCCGCGACVAGCPTGAIEMEFDDEGFWYPRIDQTKCCSCGRCKRVCFSFQT